LRYARSRADLVLMLSCVLFVGASSMNFPMMCALMTTQQFGKGASAYGLLASVLAVGSLAGALLAARRANPQLRLVILPGLGFTLLEVGVATLPTYGWFAAALPLLGLLALTMVTSAHSLIQVTATPDMRGRVFALYLMVFLGGSALAGPVLGAIGQALGARWMMAIAGAGGSVGILIASAWYARQQVRADSPVGLVRAV
jgi:MFS family permease